MILAINTSTPQFGIALIEENGTVRTRILLPRLKGHFGTLIPTLDFVLTQSGATMGDMKAVAVTSGPGSFTGLRVGLSLAKGLCRAHDLPLLGISTMAAMANGAPPSDLPVAPILPSRRNEVFTALFEWKDDAALVRVGEDTSLKIEDLPDVFRGPTLFVGNDLRGQHPIIKKYLGEKAILAPPHYWQLDPVQIGVLAMRRLKAGDVDDPSTLTPIYMRPPDIRPNPFPLLYE